MAHADFGLNVYKTVISVRTRACLSASEVIFTKRSYVKSIVRTFTFTFRDPQLTLLRGGGIASGCKRVEYIF